MLALTGPQRWWDVNIIVKAFITVVVSSTNKIHKNKKKYLLPYINNIQYYSRPFYNLPSILHAE